MKKFKFLENRHVQKTTIATIITISFLVVLILINSIASILISHYDWKIDLTSSQLYEISDQTTDFLKSYDQNAQITVLSDEQTYKTQSAYTQQAYNVLENMVAQNPSHLQLSFVDLDENPELVAQYTNEHLSTGGILIANEAGDYRYISPTDLFSQSYDTSTMQTTGIDSNVEQTVAHALEYVSGEYPVQTAIISGHQETDLSSIEPYFESNNYSLTDIKLTTDNIPDGTDLIIIAAPYVDYTDSDIAKLNDFLNNGGSIAYFAAASQPQLPTLESFLAQWGISFLPGSVVETDSSNMVDNMFSFYVYAEDNDYTDSMLDEDLPILVTYARPMQAQPVDGVTTTTLASTSSSCVYRPTGNESFNLQTADKQSYATGLASSKALENGDTAHVTAFSSVQLLGAMDVQTFGNSSFLFSTIGETANHQSAINVLPKSVTAPPLGITWSQCLLIALVFLLIIPITIVIIGIYMFVRRRHL